MVNATIHDQLPSVFSLVWKPPLLLQQYDFRQMFDGINLKESINDLYDVGVCDDTLRMVYEANQNNNFRVKTPCGLTEEGSLGKVVLQGDTWASKVASVQCDAFGKELLEGNCQIQGVHTYWDSWTSRWPDKYYRSWNWKPPNEQLPRYDDSW